MFRSPTARAVVVVTVFALIWAKSLGFTGLVDPFSFDWMYQGDWQAHLHGWLFTQNGPWALPLAQAPDLIAPHGSSAAFTDAIPIAAVIGKLVGVVVTTPFQYFGVWMVLGFVAAGVIGVLLARGFVNDTVSLSLAGALCVINPVMSLRYGHPTFLGFWLLIGLVATALWPVAEPRSARRTAMLALTLTFITCGVHAYLAVMAGGLALASIARLLATKRFRTTGEGLGWLMAVPLLCGFALWLFGFAAGAKAAGQNLATEGFGQFSADLNTLFNPATWSRIVSPLPAGPRQYEGYAYLGLGTLLLVVTRVVLLVKRPPDRRELIGLVPLGLVVLGCAFFALSNLITFNGARVADLSAFYARLGPLPGIFRSSGRFMWPLFVTITLSVIVFALRIETAWKRQALLGFAVLLQLADFDPTRSPLHRPWPAFVPFRDPTWQLLRDYRHVVIDPIELQWVCGYDSELIARLSWEAYRQHLSINSGHVGRPPEGVDCRRHVMPSELRDDTIYLPYFPEYLPDFTSSGFVCGRVEGYVLCVSPARQTPLLQALLQRRASGG